MADERFNDPQALHAPHATEHEDNGEPLTLADYDNDVLEQDEGVGSEEIHDEDESDGVHDAEGELEKNHAGPETELPASGDDVGAAPHAAGPDEPAGPGKNWYIIHAYSGFEQKVAESLRTRAQAFGFADRLGQILIPTEEVVELRNGKKVTSKRLLYPGYVLVEMEMDDELWHAVKNTPRVTGFVGGGTKPVPLTADEVNSVLYRQASSAERPRPKLTFEKNETVKIIDGPFTNFSGKIDEVNTERNTLRVMVTIFGRSTPVELDFLQVEKI
jgi:transcription termination/antitermination protein NusG